jgi:hypothetical protein
VKRLLLAGIMLAVSVVVIVPVWWAVAVSTLPSLQSEFDLERYLRDRIEGERIANAPGGRVPDKAAIAFRTPELMRYPKDMVGLYISGFGCSTYFQSPHEKSGAWLWRLIRYQLTRAEGPPGDADCEFQFARHLVWALRIRGGLRETIAIHRVRNLLPKGKLLAYDLATEEFDAGVVGLESAAETLYQRKLESLRLDELAELSLALPPSSAYDQLRLCANASSLRQARDAALVEMANQSLIPVDRARQAQAQPLACMKI